MSEIAPAHQQNQRVIDDCSKGSKGGSCLRVLCGVKKRVWATAPLCGKFFRADAELNIPIYLDPKIAEAVREHGGKRSTNVGSLANDWLPKDFHAVGQAAKMKTRSRSRRRRRGDACAGPPESLTPSPCRRYPPSAASDSSVVDGTFASRYSCKIRSACSASCSRTSKCTSDTGNGSARPSPDIVLGIPWV